MDHKELDERLSELGISIPQGTLTRWAAEGIIPSPKAYFKKRERKVGRPSSKKGAEDQPEWSRGRFMDWPGEAAEMAAAVWALRNRYEATSGVSAQNKRRNVPNETVMWVKQKGTTFHNLLETDCKEISLLLRSYLDKHGVKIIGSHDEVAWRLRDFSRGDVCPLIVRWILTIQKARRRIPVNKRLYLTYCWVIREDGESSLEEITTGDGLDGLELKVTHLKPMHNGFSMDYGFPQVDLFKNEGFENIFELGLRQWAERFRIYSTGGPYEELSDEKDPEGIADYLAELEYGDFY